MVKISMKEMAVDKNASIGIGTMVIFIAMVLVAGIAASVIIQTMNSMEQQAMKAGQETTEEVSTGISVFDIKGYVPDSGNLDNMTITVRPRAGSADIDLAEVFLELSNTDYKVIMNYDTAGSNNWNDSGTGVDDVFGVACFPVAANRFGILVLEDADGSCTETNPVINGGDKVLLCVDTTQSFSATGGINERIDIWGMVCPEQGSPGVIAFTTPALYSDNICDLQ
ncbi:MAG: flagellin [Candidatus Thermoplasmatota archaeon]|nr:flagellin [Candidatus Thermoplasmatota archaeon]